MNVPSGPSEALVPRELPACGHDGNIGGFLPAPPLAPPPAPPLAPPPLAPPSARRAHSLLFLFPGNELLSLQNKKGRNQSAAVQFVKKDWGTSCCFF